MATAGAEKGDLRINDPIPGARGRIPHRAGLSHKLEACVAFERISYLLMAN